MKRLIWVLLLFLIFGCKRSENSSVSQLQENIRRLSRENERLAAENERLQRQVQELKNSTDQRAKIPAEQKNQIETNQTRDMAMSVSEMRIQVEPLLKETIAKIKADAETPKKRNQFGMRINYDLQQAVYGLAENDEPGTPYTAKVLVRYKKYLESNEVSRAYGDGTTTFFFAYHGDRWELLNYE